MTSRGICTFLLEQDGVESLELDTPDCFFSSVSTFSTRLTTVFDVISCNAAMTDVSDSTLKLGDVGVLCNEGPMFPTSVSLPTGEVSHDSGNGEARPRDESLGSLRRPE